MGRQTLLTRSAFRITPQARDVWSSRENACVRNTGDTCLSTVVSVLDPGVATLTRGAAIL